MTSKVTRQLLSALALVDPETLPSGTAPDFTFKYLDITSASDGRLRLPRTEIEYRAAPSRARRVVRTGDVLMSTVRPNLKAFAYCRFPQGAFVASTGFAVLRAKEANVSLYLLYAILSDAVSKQIDAYSVGSSYPAINSSDIRRLQIPAFAPIEQQRIADILSMSDETIEQTEALIAKYQQIKAGMMHDLFTRGVTPDGRLRPTRAQAPELYKQSALGWIPIEWRVSSLVSLAAPFRGAFVNGPFGSDLLTTELRSSGVPVIYVQDVRAGTYERVSSAHVTERKADELRTFNVKNGDVLIGKVGTPPGSAAVYGEERRAVVTQDVIRIRPADGVVSEFLANLINSSVGWDAIKRIVIDGTRSRVSLTELKRLLCSVPPYHEQTLIADRVSQQQVLIQALDDEARKLSQQKQGLMQDLLTGRVRVQVT